MCLRHSYEENFRKAILTSPKFAAYLAAIDSDVVREAVFDTLLQAKLIEHFSRKDSRKKSGRSNGGSWLHVNVVHGMRQYSIDTLLKYAYDIVKLLKVAS